MNLQGITKSKVRILDIIRYTQTMSNPSDVPKTQTAPAPAGRSLVDELPEDMTDTIDRDLQEGDKVGEYEVSGKLGEGGFGTVYKAVQPLIGKKVAIKVLKRQFSANPSTLSRFIQEARAVNQIQHRYIIYTFIIAQVFRIDTIIRHIHRETGRLQCRPQMANKLLVILYQ